jgi:DNA-binding LacI/PurR family transcriptional regulator
VAYDDVVAGLGTPPLTAVSPPKAEVGKVAARVLLRRLAEAPGAGWSVRRVELLPRLTVRGSTRPVGAAPAGRAESAEGEAVDSGHE